MTVHPPSIVVTRPDYERLSNLVDSAGHGPVSTFLADELDRARIVEASEVEGAVVTMHSRFVFRDDSTGEIRTASLVYPGEEDIDAGRISVLTPIGAALLGLSRGQSINWKTRSGTPRLLTVVEILPQA
jgi:regulator of nucleoside diphosphate kinase